MTNIKIKETVSQLESAMNRAVGNIVNEAVIKSIPNIRQRIVLVTPPIWKDTETYRSLVEGRLNSQFGFHYGTAKDKVDAIIHKAAESLFVDSNFALYARTFKCTINIYVLKRDLYDVLDMYEGIIVTKKDDLLYWTDWLLRQGNRIIVKQHSFIPKLGEGRSGGGIMVDSRKGTWRVPPEHSGVLGNNWLTRSLENAMASIMSQYEQIIDQEVRSNIDVA